MKLFERVLLKDTLTLIPHNSDRKGYVFSLPDADDLIGFVRQIEHLTLPEAVEHLDGGRLQRRETAARLQRDFHRRFGGCTPAST